MTTDDIRKWAKQHKYSESYAEYWIAHRTCEATGNMPSGPPHHINSRGAHGNVDEPWNLLALSPARHTEYHNIGHQAFARRYPHLTDKIRAAREKVGKGW